MGGVALKLLTIVHKEGKRLFSSTKKLFSTVSDFHEVKGNLCTLYDYLRMFVGKTAFLTRIKDHVFSKRPIEIVIGTVYDDQK